MRSVLFALALGLISTIYAAPTLEPRADLEDRNFKPQPQCGGYKSGWCPKSNQICVKSGRTYSCKSKHAPKPSPVYKPHKERDESSAPLEERSDVEERNYNKHPPQCQGWHNGVCPKRNQVCVQSTRTKQYSCKDKNAPKPSPVYKPHRERDESSSSALEERSELVEERSVLEERNRSPPQCGGYKQGWCPKKNQICFKSGRTYSCKHKNLPKPSPVWVVL